MHTVPSRTIRPGRRRRTPRPRAAVERLDSRVLLSADLSVSKSATPAVVAIGQPVTTTITATNSGNSNASNVRVVDFLPANVQFISTNPPTGIYHPIGNFVSFNLGQLKAGSSSTLQVTTVPTQSSAITDWATIFAGAGGAGSGNGVASARIAPIPPPTNVADVAVTDSSYPSPISTGSNETFLHTVTNNGPADATNVVVTDALPPSVTYVSSSPGGTFDAATHTVVFTFPKLPSGQSQDFQVVGTPTTSGVFTDYLDVRAQQTDSTPSNNDAGATFQVHGTPSADIADVAVWQSVKNTPNGQGQSNTYNLHVLNTGPGAATGVIVTDYLPLGTSFTSTGMSGPSGTYDASTNTVVFHLGTMAAGSSQDLSIKVTDNLLGQVTNRVLVRADQADASPTYFEQVESGNGQDESGANEDANESINGQDADAVANNLSTSPYEVLPTPLPSNTDVSVVAVYSPVGPTSVGSPVTYTFTVSNNGMSTASNVVLTDQIGPGANFVSSSPNGAYYPDSGVVVLNLGNLAANQTTTAQVTVIPEAPGTVSNLALVRFDGIDTTPGNNTTETDVTIGPAPQVQTFLVYGRGRSTALTATFSQPMEPGPAGDLSNYALVKLGRSGRLGAPGERAIPLRAVTYLSDRNTAVIEPAGPLNLHGAYALIINGRQPGGLVSVTGTPLLDNQTGTTGGQYVQGFNYWYSTTLAPYVPGSPFSAQYQVRLAPGLPGRNAHGLSARHGTHAAGLAHPLPPHLRRR